MSFTSSGSGTTVTNIVFDLNTNETSQMCSECGSYIPTKIYSKHNDKICELTKWRKREAAKYDMVSVWKFATKDFNFAYVSKELKAIYPKVVSKLFDCLDEEGREMYDIFVERRDADTIAQYIKSGGYAGLSLAEFLDKTITERQANVAPKED